MVSLLFVMHGHGLRKIVNTVCAQFPNTDQTIEQRSCCYKHLFVQVQIS